MSLQPPDAQRRKLGTGRRIQQDLSHVWNRKKLNKAGYRMLSTGDEDGGELGVEQIVIQGHKT